MNWNFIPGALFEGVNMLLCVLSVYKQKLFSVNWSERVYMINSPHICNEMTPFQRLNVVTRNGIHVKHVFETTNIILNFIGKEKLTAVVLLHMSKAFDSVNHKTLILKLQDVGTSSHTLHRFLNYLSNRKQVLHIHSTLS